MLELMVFNVCGLLEFVEILYVGIDGFNMLTKYYMMKLMVFNVCVLLEFVERLYVGIDGFNVCVLLELSDSLYVGVVTTCVLCSEFVIRCRMPNDLFCSEIVIHC